MYIKSLFLAFILLSIFTGCSKHYILSTASNPSEHFTPYQGSIGVEKVVVPKYLYKREIAVAKSRSEVYFLDSAVWAEDLEEGLTQRVIAFLQKKFRQPDIYPYPWGVEKNPTVKLKVNITRFIALGNTVYLEANFTIVHLKTDKTKARLFSIALPTKNDAGSIVASMDRAFGALEEAIAKALR